MLKTLKTKKLYVSGLVRADMCASRNFLKSDVCKSLAC